MKKFIFVIIIFCLTVTSFAVLYDKIVFTENKNITSDFAVFSSLALTGYIFDEEIRNMFPKNTEFPLENYTDGKVLLGLNSSLLAYSFLISDKELRNVSLRSFQSFFAAGSITYVIKNIFGRSRPYTENGKNNFNFLGAISDDYKSFPSGHSAFAWSVFTPIAEKYGKFLYIIPLFISAERIAEDAHWTSDVITGSMIGYFTGKYMPYFQLNF